MQAYAQLENRVGNQLDDNTLIGPLIDKVIVKIFQNALTAIEEQGRNIVYGGDLLEGHSSELYLRPALAEVENNAQLYRKRLLLHCYT